MLALGVSIVMRGVIGELARVLSLMRDDFVFRHGVHFLNDP